MSQTSQMMAPGPAAFDRAQAEDLLLHEARLLDERRLEEWVELFTEDGYYWVPAKPGQENPFDEVSLFFDDREFMATRMQRLRHPRAHSQNPPTRTYHMVNGVRIEPEAPADTDYLVSSGLVMFEYRPGEEQRVYGGRCEHAIRVEQSQTRIFWKKVMLVNCDAVFGALTVPF